MHPVPAASPIEVAAVDIDDTTCRFYEPYVERAARIFGVPDEEIWREELVDRAHVEWDPSVFPLTPGAGEALEVIARIRPVVFPSARPTYLVQASIAQIASHLPGLDPLDFIHVGRNGEAMRGPAHSKYDALVARGYLPIIAVEDNERAAADYLAHGVETFFVRHRGGAPPGSDKLHVFSAYEPMWRAVASHMLDLRPA